MPFPQPPRQSRTLANIRCFESSTFLVSSLLRAELAGAEQPVLWARFLREAQVTGRLLDATNVEGT
jgi:hypothetical protein